MSTIDGKIETTFVGVGQKKDKTKWLRISDGISPIFFDIDEHVYEDIISEEFERGDTITISLNYNIFSKRGVVVSVER